MNFRDCRDILMIAKKIYENQEQNFEADLHLLYIISDTYGLFQRAVKNAFDTYPLMFYVEFDRVPEYLEKMEGYYSNINAMADADTKPEKEDGDVVNFLKLLDEVYGAFVKNGYSITNQGEYYTVENENRRVFSPEDALEYKEALRDLED